MTQSEIGTGSAITATGDISASATHHGVSTLLADGTALGGDTAIGAAIGLGFVENRARSKTKRNLTADSVSLTAAGDGASTVTAKASSEGEESGGDADQQQTKQTNFANSRSGKANSSGQSASTDSGQVSVAAALAINVSDSIVQTSVADDSTINATDGSLSLQSSNNMDAKAIADGSAKTTSGGTAVGVAVSINVAHHGRTRRS